MFIIKISDTEKYWTDIYLSADGWVSFDVKTKKGGTQKYRIRENIIEQIVDVGEQDFDA